MPEFIAAAVDLAFVCLAGEVAFLAWRTRTGDARAVWNALPAIGAGLFLLLAFRMTLWGLPTAVVLASLAAGGLCHMLDFKRLLARVPSPRRT